ncbi:MAG TPA: transglycosylase SLT domain-containing protein, partial [Chloroflexota bacterium]|nr:transglycosylase SLT domain-containing protein [Chloroflexota bacterium]
MITPSSATTPIPAAWPGRNIAAALLGAGAFAFVFAARLSLLPLPRPAAGPVITHAAPAVPTAIPTPRPAWQPPEGQSRPYTARVERWRPMARQLLAEAWDEGRLDGRAAILDDDFVLSIIEAESAGDPNVTSWAGAIGLMQVMPFTFAEMHTGSKANESLIDPAAMWDVASNMRAGIRYLALALQAHDGNRYWAAAAYNGGIEAVAVWRAAGLYAVPPIGGYWETAAYAQKVARSYVQHRPNVALS